MNFETTYKKSAILLSLLVLFSTFKLSVEKHFCGGNLVDVAVFSDTKPCCPSDVLSADVLVEDGCCTNETEVLTAVDQLISQTTKFSVAADVYVPQNSHFAFKNPHFKPTEVHLNCFSNAPPFVKQNLHKLLETYII